MDVSHKMLAVIALGYVGLPPLVGFGKRKPVIGFGIGDKQVKELQGGNDHTLECSRRELRQTKVCAVIQEPENMCRADRPVPADLKDLYKKQQAQDIGSTVVPL